MTSGNYAKHMKILGKLCHVYDQAAAGITALNLALAALVDQAATGASAGNDAMLMVAAYANTINNQIASGPTAIQATVKALTQQYMQSTVFTADFVENTPSDGSITAIISALGDEMSDNSESFTTAGSTGMVHFLKALFGTPSPTDYPTSGSPTRADATYVVSTQV